MSIPYRIIALSTFAPSILTGCGSDLVGPTVIDTPQGAVQLSIAVDASQTYETCREVRIQAKAAIGKHPVRGIVVNFVPLGGSVFAAAVVTNKDGVATTYWKLGRVFDASALIARAVDENGTRVLDDTLAVDKRQRPTTLDYSSTTPFWPWGSRYEPPPPPPGTYRFISRARLLDNCGDPIPSALLRARFSGPATPIEPVEQTVQTINFNFPDADFWGFGVVGYQFTSRPSGRYEVAWQVVDAPQLVVTSDWVIR